MVGRLVEDEEIAAFEHGFCKHTPDLFSAGQNFHTLLRFFARKKHSAQPAAHEFFIMIVRILRKPIYQIFVVIFKILGIIFRHIADLDGAAPFIRAAIRLFFSRQNIEKHGDRAAVVTHETDFFAFLHNEG